MWAHCWIPKLSTCHNTFSCPWTAKCTSQASLALVKRQLHDNCVVTCEHNTRCWFHSSVMPSYECHECQADTHAKAPRAVLPKTGALFSAPFCRCDRTAQHRDRNTCGAINTYSCSDARARSSTGFRNMFLCHSICPRHNPNTHAAHIIVSCTSVFLVIFKYVIFVIVGMLAPEFVIPPRWAAAAFACCESFGEKRIWCCVRMNPNN